MRFGLVMGQKRKRSGIKIRLLRLVSHSLGDVFKVPHARSTVLSTFPAFKKVFSYLECGAFYWEHATTERLRF